MASIAAEQTAPASPVAYVVLGHLAKDLTPAGPRLGGTAAYAALTAQALGYPPGLVTAYAGEEAWLAPLAGVARQRRPAAVSTTFENSYGPAGRRQYLRAVAPALTLADVPAAWRAAAIYHLGPIARELEPDVVPALAAAGHLVGLTPQGWLRQWDTQGQVTYTPWPEARRILPLASAVVLSIEDVQGDWAEVAAWAAAARVLVVTEGARGCTVFVAGQAPQPVPAPAAAEVDPTGAGDIFAAAFFIRLHETRSPYLAAQFANTLAARSVSRPGVAGVPTAAEASQARQGPAATG